MEREVREPARVISVPSFYPGFVTNQLAIANDIDAHAAGVATQVDDQAVGVAVRLDRLAELLHDVDRIEEHVQGNVLRPSLQPAWRLNRT